MAALVLGVLASVAVYPLCGLAFRCGCLMMGFGGAEHCNVHHPWGPHCPWCEHVWLGMVGFLLALLFQLLVYLPVWKRSRSAAAAFFAAALSFPLAALLGAFLTWLPTDYPHFLAREARDALGLPNGPIRCVVPELRLPRAEGPPQAPLEGP